MPSSRLMRSILVPAVLALGTPTFTAAQAAPVPEPPPPATSAAPALDFATFATKVQPLFLAKREGLMTCMTCHDGKVGTRLQLDTLPEGATLERGGGPEELQGGVVAGRARVADDQPVVDCIRSIAMRAATRSTAAASTGVAERSRVADPGGLGARRPADADQRGDAAPAPRCGSSRPTPPATART